MANKFILTSILSFFFFAAWSQTAPAKLTWKQLQDIDYESKFVKEADMEVMFPKFPSTMLKFDGKEVIVEGFVIPFDKSGTKVALSAYPYASCFFCGKAGPASVLTVELKTPNKKYNTDDYITFKGKLVLNSSDIKEFYYILKGAIEVKQ